MKFNEENSSLSIYNEVNESIIYKDEVPNYAHEFSKNQLIVTSAGGTHMYYIKDW